MKSRWRIALLVLLFGPVLLGPVLLGPVLLGPGLLGWGAPLAAAAPPLPSLDAADLARGPFSSMHMLLEKTFLNIDVATIDVRVGKGVQASFAKLASGQRYSEALDAQLAQVALSADHALIQLAFVRDVPLQRWIGGVRESLEKASRAGLIRPELQQRVSAGLPEWFKAVEVNGFQNGDRVLYEIRYGGVRTIAVTRAGTVLVDRIDKGDAIPRVVLASYFAPDTDYRTLLLQSLLVRR